MIGSTWEKKVCVAQGSIKTQLSYSIGDTHTDTLFPFTIFYNLHSNFITKSFNTKTTFKKTLLSGINNLNCVLVPPCHHYFCSISFQQIYDMMIWGRTRNLPTSSKQMAKGQRANASLCWISYRLSITSTITLFSFNYLKTPFVKSNFCFGMFLLVLLYLDSFGCGHGWR